MSGGKDQKHFCGDDKKTPHFSDEKKAPRLSDDEKKR
jgi:hypothetical protein